MTDKSRSVVIIIQNMYEFSMKKKIGRSIIQSREKTGGIYLRKKKVEKPNETCSDIHQALTEAI